MISTLVGKFVANIGGNPAALNTYNSFTVNNAVAQVTVSQAAPVWAYAFFSPGGLTASRLARADNFTVLSYGIRLPYHFTTGVVSPEMFFVATDGAVNPWIPLETGSVTFNGSFHPPDANYEHSLNQFFTWPVTGLLTFASIYLGVYINAFDVSMIGVDALLNTAVLYPEPFIKIEHTVALL